MTAGIQVDKGGGKDKDINTERIRLMPTATARVFATFNAASPALAAARRKG